MSELARVVAFEETLRERCAERVVPFPFGQALFNDSYPRVWDLNLLRVDKPSGATVDALVAKAERLHGEAGHEHRRIAVLDEAAGARLKPGFLSLGWRVERFLFMVFRGGGDRTVDTSAVREVGPGVVRPVREEVARDEPWATDEKVVQMVLDAEELMARKGSSRHFAAFVEDHVGCAATLYSNGRTAQVEDVATRPAFRGRGLASAVVLRAVEEAVASGHDLVFLIADDDDWPKELYGRLGFRPLGRTWVFFRPPPAPVSPA